MSDQGRLVAGRYRFAESIGRGGMGTVWRAEDELLGRQVAVKKLRVPPDLQDDELERLYERTRREARSAARIAHPNVVVVHDVVEDEGLPCVVMEYVRSRTLSDVLKEDGPITPREAARIGRGMVAALRAAHRAGVLHRDVKPANVLLGLDTPHSDDGWPGGRVVLTDFGIASATGTSTLTRTGELIGSFDYLAPERITGGNPGPASDLWALGATLYQAVEGAAPFHRDTPIETAYAIASEPIATPRNAGPLTSLIESLLAKEPERRMTAEQVERLLVSSVETVLAREPGAPADSAGSGGTAVGAATGTGAGGGTRAGFAGRQAPSWAVRDDEEHVEGPTTSFPRQSTGPDAEHPYDDRTSTPSPTSTPTGAQTPVGASTPTGAQTPTAGTFPDANAPTPAPTPAAGTFAEANAPTGGTRTGNYPADHTVPAALVRHSVPDDHTVPVRHHTVPADHTTSAAPASEPSSDGAAAAADPSFRPSGRQGRQGRRHGLLPIVLVAVVAVAAAGVGGAYLGQRGALPWQGRPGPSGSPSPALSPAPSHTPQPAPTAPTGYRLMHGSGFTVAVADGWRPVHKPYGETDFISPDDRSELIVSVLDFAGPALQHWEELETQIKPKEPGYRRLRMDKTQVIVNGKPEDAALWEWTWQASVLYHAKDLGFGKEGGTEYALYVSGPDAEWNQEDTWFDVAARTFRPYS